MKRLLLVLSVLFIAPALLFGCSEDDESEAVLMIDNEKILRKEFEYQLVSLMSAYEYYNGSPIDWSLPIESQRPEDYFRQQAADTALLYRTVRIKGEEMGLGLTEDELAGIDRTISDMIEQAGGEKSFEKQLEKQGLDISLYRYILAGPEAYYKIYQNLYGEGGELTPTEDDVREYYHREYLQTRHIVIFLTEEDGTPLTGGDERRQRSRMEEVYGLLRNGNDFGELMETYNEDSGVNGTSLCFSYGEMPEDYYQASVSLEPYGFSEILELDGYLCVINRLPLEDSFLEENRDPLREECAVAAFDELIEEWKKELKIKKTPLYDNIDVRALYSSTLSNESDG